MLSFLAAMLHSICFFGAIGEIAAFPKPFDKAEETYWIGRLQSGDEEAAEQLIVHNLRLVAHIAKKYEKNNGADRDDLISCGTIGLIKAVRTFSEAKGSLSGYASRCIENEILMSFRREKKLVQTVSMEEPIGQDKEGNDLSIAELVGTDQDAIFEQVQKRLDADRVHKAMRRALNKREQRVLSLRYGLGGGSPLPQRAVAEILGLSRSYISRIETRAMEKLKAALVEQPSER